MAFINQTIVPEKSGTQTRIRLTRVVQFKGPKIWVDTTLARAKFQIANGGVNTLQAFTGGPVSITVLDVSYQTQHNESGLEATAVRSYTYEGEAHAVQTTCSKKHSLCGPTWDTPFGKGKSAVELSRTVEDL